VFDTDQQELETLVLFDFFAWPKTNWTGIGRPEIDLFCIISPLVLGTIQDHVRVSSEQHAKPAMRAWKEAEKSVY
jgi:hypothetical protein